MNFPCLFGTEYGGKVTSVIEVVGKIKANTGRKMRQEFKFLDQCIGE